jgi:hypothetical protein
VLRLEEATARRCGVLAVWAVLALLAGPGSASADVSGGLGAVVGDLALAAGPGVPPLSALGACWGPHTFRFAGMADGANVTAPSPPNGTVLYATGGFAVNADLVTATCGTAALETGDVENAFLGTPNPPVLGDVGTFNCGPILGPAGTFRRAGTVASVLVDVPAGACHIDGVALAAPLTLTITGTVYPKSGCGDGILTPIVCASFAGGGAVEGAQP